MKTTALLFAILKLSAVLVLLAIASAAHSATLTWTNTSGGNWSVAANWSPNQVPTNTDNVLITTPGTYTVVFDLAYTLYNMTNAANLTLGAGGGVAGIQTVNFSSSRLSVSSLLLVTNGGVLQITNDTLAGNLIIDHGGMFSGLGETLSGPLTIQNGGVMNTVNGSLATIIVTNGGVLNASGDKLDAPVTVANGGLLNELYLNVGDSLTVAHGGVLNVEDSPVDYALSLYVSAPIYNMGTINLTNGTIDIYNNAYGGGYGGLVNQPGGSIKLWGNGSIFSELGESEYYFGFVINQGTITQMAGTNSISAPVADNRLGTITNLSGIMTFGLIQTNLAGTYFASAGATIQFVAADIANQNEAPQLTLGTPLVLNGSGQYQLLSGYLYLPTDAPPPNLELLGDTLQLGPDFQGGAITNLTLDGMRLLNALPITGTFTATNSNIATNLVVANGGVFSYEGLGLLNGTVAVGSGGVFNVIGSVGNFNYYSYILLDHRVTVAHGGVMNCEGYFTITTLTNAGTLNLAAQLVLLTTANGIVNQPGGVINLKSNAVITIAATNDYFINQGSIVQNAGTGATNTISYQKGIGISGGPFNGDSIDIYEPFAFDNSQGTITNLSGTLVLPSFPSTLAGTFYAAAGATIQMGGGTIAAPLVPGTPLVLGGSGQYQFISGYLYLPANVPANLSLQGGLLALGAGFQGGAITNLALDGITLSNSFPATLPITGTFTVMNSGNSGTLNNSLYGWAGFYGNGIYGNYSVAGGGVLNVSTAVMYGTVTVTNGGVLNVSSPSTYPPPGETYLYGNIYVERGGVLNASSYYNYLYGNLTIANGGILNGSASMYGAVTVASGGVLNPDSSIELYGPLTNSGTINLTNAGISILNDGTTNEQGGLINEAGGVINLFTGYGYVNGGGYPVGYDYFINQGQIIKSAGTGSLELEADFATNSGTITAQTGQILMAGQWTLLSSGSLNVVLNSATNYGSFIISTNYPNIVGNADLAGAFNATLNTGYVPTNGTTFNVLSYGSFTGSFTSLGLPSAVSWQSTYGSTNLTLLVGSPKPQFGTFNLSGTNLIFNGLGGPPGSNYVVLVSTNLTIPLANWSALITNTFDGNGQFHYTNPVSPSKPRQFFIFKLP